MSAQRNDDIKNQAAQHTGAGKGAAATISFSGATTPIVPYREFMSVQAYQQNAKAGINMP